MGSSRKNAERRKRAIRPAVLLAALALLGSATRGEAAPEVPRAGCVATSLELAERLEPVIEAAIDGRPAHVRAASKRARAWWLTHRATLADTAAVTRAMADLREQAATRHTLLAARAAVIASTVALDACSEPAIAASHLMRIDLAGMAGWLRAHGVEVAFPRGAAESASTVGDGLRARGHARLADRFVAEVAATLAIPVRSRGDVRSANRLLERVDEVERVAQ